MTSIEFQNAQPQAPPTGRILNVEDALSYLEAVKVAYRDQPEVYNRFLDIMKDFRTSSINAIQVIDQSVDLFQGRPELIEGLSTFLPTGYQLQVAGDSVIITTPSGVTTRPLQAM